MHDERRIEERIFNLVKPKGLVVSEQQPPGFPGVNYSFNVHREGFTQYAHVLCVLDLILKADHVAVSLTVTGNNKCNEIKELLKSLNDASV